MNDIGFDEAYQRMETFLNDLDYWFGDRSEFFKANKGNLLPDQIRVLQDIWRIRRTVLDQIKIGVQDIKDELQEKIGEIDDMQNDLDQMDDNAAENESLKDEIEDLMNEIEDLKEELEELRAQSNDKE